MRKAVYNLIPENDTIQIGMIVLQSDVTIEDEFRHYFKDLDVSILVSRIPFVSEVTAETLQDMAAHLTHSAALFPTTHCFDAIGYACTSGAMQIGSNTIAKLLRTERSCTFVSDPMQAAISAFRALNAKNIGYIGPYSRPVCQTMVDHIESKGLNVTHSVIFDEKEDKYVGRISPATIYETAIDLAANAKGEIDAIFIACTNMKCASVLTRIHHKTGIPALSSNKVLAWDLACSTGLTFAL